ncbi:hypothetical protein GDO86_012230 [Hymenochirus boettgeri]|uniref:Probable G-protein coupled receptor 33 n=1 Tax=Hymenochirus boettgeri TaxID=247094 RepID=A0A8T2ILH0_9PIPI|nr:hypothetical protein GDO86_012230 [Hymenochirus boettgeri]
MTLLREIHRNITSQKKEEAVPTTNIISTVVLLVTFLFGLVVNNLYLWVTGFKMPKNINTTWFFHLILSNIVFTLTMPLVAIYMLTFPHWVFGSFLCKLINVMISLGMYTNVFFLTIIGLDRYTLVYHPVWYRGHMNRRYASALCIFFWGLGILCSSPYFAFRQVRLLDDNKTVICYNDYTISAKPGNESSAIQIKWFMFGFRLLASFLLPFFVIAFCHIKIGLRMKNGNLSRSSKPYKILFITVISFFISYLPYHLWYGMSIKDSRFHKTFLDALKVIAMCLACFHYCFTPILYLLIAEKFKTVFRKSVLSLIESVLNEIFSTWNRGYEENTCIDVNAN